MRTPESLFKLGKYGRISRNPVNLRPNSCIFDPKLVRIRTPDDISRNPRPKSPVMALGARETIMYLCSQVKETTAPTIVPGFQT